MITKSQEMRSAIMVPEMETFYGDKMMTLQQGKEEMKQRCCQVALQNTPESVLFVRIRKNLSGRAFLRSGVLAGPRPATRKALYIFLHECAHFHLHSDGKKRKRYIEEYEAEMWAHQKMRAASIPVPRSMTKSAKKYVTRKIKQAENRGLKKVRSDVKKFAK